MFFKVIGLTILTLSATWLNQAVATTQQLNQGESKPSNNLKMEQYCSEWSKKLRTVKYQGCLELDLKNSGFNSVQGRMLTERHFKPAEDFKHLPEGR
ncbi:MAG: hypothetical protein U9N57_07560, partial [Pseudomonadota bacterium]|nr:hypothetical protein [Pseudomonadota bacterium]